MYILLRKRAFRMCAYIIYSINEKTHDELARSHCSLDSLNILKKQCCVAYVSQSNRIYLRSVCHV